MTIDSEWASAADRWLAADRGGREVEADAEFGLLLRLLPRAVPAGDLEARIWHATRWVRVRARVWMMLRRAGTAAAAVGLAAATLYLTATLLVPLAARSLTRLVGWMVRGVVWIMLAFNEGLDTWSLLARVGRGIGEALATPEATAALIVIELIGALALYTLNRLLAGEKEISQ